MAENKLTNTVDNLLLELDGMLHELRVDEGPPSNNYHTSMAGEQIFQDLEQRRRPSITSEKHGSIGGMTTVSSTRNASTASSSSSAATTTMPAPTLGSPRPTTRPYHPSSADIYHHHSKHESTSHPVSPTHSSSTLDVFKSYNEPRVYASPVDKTLASITSLPDAYAGWIQKASYSLLNTRSLKNRYIVLANCTLYLFYSDIHPHENEYYESYAIQPGTFVHVKERGLYCLELHVASSIMMGDGLLFEKTPVSKVIELQCSEKEDMIVWLDCFKEVIEEAKLGRTPLPFRKDAPNIKKLSHRRSSSADLAPSPTLPKSAYPADSYHAFPPAAYSSHQRPSLDYGDLSMTKTQGYDALIDRERKTKSEGKKGLASSSSSSEPPKLTKLDKEILKEERKLEKLRLKKEEQVAHLKKLANMAAATEGSGKNASQSKKYKTMEEQMQFFLAAGSAAGYF